MNDRQKTVAAVAIILGFIFIVVIIVGAIVSKKNVVSPIPDDAAIKITFVTPSPTAEASPSAAPQHVGVALRQSAGTTSGRREGKLHCAALFLRQSLQGGEDRAGRVYAMLRLERQPARRERSQHTTHRSRSLLRVFDAA